MHHGAHEHRDDAETVAIEAVPAGAPVDPPDRPVTWGYTGASFPPRPEGRGIHEGNSMNVISIDAECNTLAGQAFCVALTNNAGGEVDHAIYRCPIVGPVSDWVAGNVLPAINDVPVNCRDYQDLLTQVRETITRWGGRQTMITHVAWPVEARLLLDVYPGEQVWHGPYPLVDVSSLLLARGHDPLSVDDYLRAKGVPLPEGTPHNPLYDARAAARCYLHLMA